MPRATISAALGALLAALASCDTSSQSECHRRVVERFGCCPACDAECRAAVSQECAELHDEPLPRLDDDAASSGTSDGGVDDEPTPAPQ